MQPQRLCRARIPATGSSRSRCKQLDAGAQPRPRTPDWAKVEELLGIELNKALQAGSGGGAALDAAAGKVTSYLKQAGYYE